MIVVVCAELIQASSKPVIENVWTVFVGVHVNVLVFQTNNICFFISGLLPQLLAKVSHSLCFAFGFSFCTWFRAETPVYGSEVLNYMFLIIFFAKIKRNLNCGATEHGRWVLAFHIIWLNYICYRNLLYLYWLNDLRLLNGKNINYISVHTMNDNVLFVISMHCSYHLKL